MKESRFIDQNSKKWSTLHKALNEKKKDPGLLSKLYIQITDDLSYARTFYANRSIRNYLNALAEGIFINIHREKKSRVKDFLRFWNTTLPLMNYQARGDFLLSLIIFSLAVVIGVVSTINDTTFPAFILGEDYVVMAKENITKGDPMSVYKEFIPVEGFFRITINNLWVAAYTFVFGVFSAIGTVFILLFNGVMVGTFQQFYINEGLFSESFLTIWQHGTIEISSIILAGGAGLTMGKGLLFPGTYSRLQSFGMSARRGLIIFIGVVPPIIIAGFIEGFLTRYTDLPDALRIGFILFSLAVMLIYYVWYPAVVAKRVSGKDIKKEKLEVPGFKEASYTRIYSAGQLFENTMGFLGRHFSSMLKPALWLSVLSVVSIYVVLGDEFNELSQEWLTPGHNYWMYFFNFTAFNYLPPVVAVCFAMAFLLYFRKFFKQDFNGLTIKKPSLGRIIGMSFFVSCIISIMFFMNFWLAFIVLIFLIPILLSIAFVFLTEKVNFFNAIGRGIHLFFYRKSISLGTIFRAGLLIPVSVFFVKVLLGLFPELIIFLMNMDEDQYLLMWSLLDIFSFFVPVYLGLGMFVIAIGNLSFTIREIQTADNLLARIDNFGQSKKILGYERE
jgi:uncharacterized membrane protein SpoIIM required for sporulation